jgi:hypothetical protein
MFYLGASAELETVTISFVMSVRPPTCLCLSVRSKLTRNGRIFMKVDIWVFFVTLSRNLNVVSTVHHVYITTY